MSMKMQFLVFVLSVCILLGVTGFFVVQMHHFVEPLIQDYDTYSKDRIQSYFRLILFFVALLFVMAFVFPWVAYKRFWVRVDKLVETSLRVEKGDFETRNQVLGKDELGIVGKALDSVTLQLKESLHLLHTNKLQLDSELNIAREIQMSMIPLTFPPFPDVEEFDLYAHLMPARQVGGDFYDFYLLDKDHLCFVMGDVSGKGVPAALLMAVCRTLLKARAQDDFSPASIITHVNAEISKENPSCMFVTIFIAVLNINTGLLTYTNAGHTSTLLKHQNGKVSLLEGVHGPVVGAMEDITYEESRRDLEVGESLFLYTDGVTEAHNPKNDMYSEEKLIEFIKNHNFTSAKGVINDLLSELKDFESGREPFDDTTILCLKYLKSAMDPLAKKTIEITNDVEKINTVIDGFNIFAQKHNVPEAVLMKIHLAFDDVLSNIVQYAYPEGGKHKIVTNFQIYSDQVLITIIDDGQPFNPLLANTPDTELSLEERVIGGLGIHLVKNIMDDCRYRRKIDQNILVLSKKF